jgi:hypothetical protein
MHFEVPASVALPGATLLVRIDALDPHDNRLATREQSVHVEAFPPPAPLLSTAPLRPPIDLPKVPPAPPARAVMSFHSDAKGGETRDHAGAHGGFWSSPWPYVLGGVVLAAGGALAYYELRPTDDVSLGGARVVAR